MTVVRNELGRTQRFVDRWTVKPTALGTSETISFTAVKVGDIIHEIVFSVDTPADTATTSSFSLRNAAGTLLTGTTSFPLTTDSYTTTSYTQKTIGEVENTAGQLTFSYSAGTSYGATNPIVTIDVYHTPFTYSD